MNSNIMRRAFSSIYNYSSASNPRVFLSVANQGNKLGDLVFELYEDKQPAFAERFQEMLAGRADGKGFVGTSFQKGMAGLGVYAGKSSDDNSGASGYWEVDGDLTLRHYKRGMLSSPISGPSRNGTEFMVTFNEAQFLNGSQTVFGELVEGHDVLAEIEKHCDRHGKVAEGLEIVAGGAKE